LKNSGKIHNLVVWRRIQIIKNNGNKAVDKYKFDKDQLDKDQFDKDKFGS
jgi:hypothetical protein